MALDQWTEMYDTLFKAVEPYLALVLQRAGGSGVGEKEGADPEVHVWRFLASLGTGASHEQQQKLCLAVVYVFLSSPQPFLGFCLPTFGNFC